MKIIKDRITIEELKDLAHEQFINVIKGVVDIKQEIIAVGGEFHSDLETLLLENENSQRADTWGINFRLDKSDDEFVQFDSMINLKPLSGNMTRSVDDPAVRERIIEIINKIVKK